MSDFDVIVSHPGGRGWGPIELLGQLAATELGGNLIRCDASENYSRLHMLRGLVPARRASKSQRKALVIAPHPGHLNALLHSPTWLRNYSSVHGWVIDSFWTDRVPRIAHATRYYDHLYVTDPGDVAGWETAGAASVSVLPWGTDALQMPFFEERPTDVQRIGRQPDEWDNDTEAAAAAASVGVELRGRPPFGASDEESQRFADEAAARAKFVLAFSNRAHSSSYTHPTREYLTGRWLNALAAGASVAGITPKTQVAQELLWPGACLELTSTARATGLREIAHALTQWTPEAARENRRRALLVLDWRHRLKVIGQNSNLETPRLDAALSKIATAAAELDSSE